MSDAAHFKTQAERARKLAIGNDPRTTDTLLKLAAEYEQKARELEAREAKPDLPPDNASAGFAACGLARETLLDLRKHREIAKRLI